MKWTYNKQDEAVLKPQSSVTLLWYITLGLFLLGLCLIIPSANFHFHNYQDLDSWFAQYTGLLIVGIMFWFSALCTFIPASLLAIKNLQCKGIEFTTERLPLSVGSRFRGVMILRGQLPDNKDANVRLFCQKYITSRRIGTKYSNRSTHDTIWEDICHVPLDAVKITGNRTSIPVNFTIPYVCHPSYPNSNYKWWLQYKHVKFELPVARDQYSDTEITEDSVTDTKLIEDPEILLQAWERSRIFFNRSNERNLMLEVPPVIQRHPAHVFFMMILSLGFALFGFYIVLTPGIPSRIIGSFLLIGSVISAVVTLRMFITSTAISLGPEGLTIVWNHIFFKTRKRISLSVINRFKFEISSTGGVNEKETVTYRFTVRLSGTAQRAIKKQKSLKKSIKEFFLIFDEPEVKLIGALKSKEIVQALDSTLNNLLDKLKNN